MYIIYMIFYVTIRKAVINEGIINAKFRYGNTWNIFNLLDSHQIKKNLNDMTLQSILLQRLLFTKSYFL